MGTIHTRLRIVNNTSTDITNTSVSDVDNFDWDRGAGPHHNFNGVFIGSKRSEERREEVNKQASNCPFTMTLTFRDGTVDTFRINQKSALGCGAGFNHIRRSHNIYHERTEDNLLKITIENTQQQLQNEQAEERNKEGEAAMRQKQYEAAIRKFEEALRSANESNTVNRIKANKAEAYHQHGQTLAQKAWDLEADSNEDKSQEATSKFNEAKLMFQQAESLRHSAAQQESLKMVDMKIEGNRLFNEGNKLEKEAFRLFAEARESKMFDNYTTSQNKYKEALDKYKLAKEKFEEGSKGNDGRFEACSKFTSDHIEDVLKVIDDIDKAELSHNISKVNVSEKKEEKSDLEEQLNKNRELQEQLDVEDGGN